MYSCCLFKQNHSVTTAVTPAQTELDRLGEKAARTRLCVRQDRRDQEQCCVTSGVTLSVCLT